MSYNTTNDSTLAGRQGDAYGSVNTTGAGVGSDNLSSSAHGPAPTTKGPHSSDMANKVDPRVDSDNSKGYGNTSSYPSGGAGHTTDTSASRSATGGYGSSGNAYDSTTNSTSGITGSSAAGTSGLGNTSSNYGSSTTGTSGLGSSTTGYGSTSTNAGPHDSNVANKADPRVDSDLDRSRGLGSNTTSSGIGGTTGTSNYGSSTTGYGSTSTNAGPHDSNVANKADPRVDSDRSNTYGSSTTGTHSSIPGNTTTGGATNTNTTGYGSSNSNVVPGENGNKDSTMGKLMEKAGHALKKEDLVEKGHDKRVDAAVSK